MERKNLLAYAVAAAFALPFAGQASAAGDSIILAADGPSGASSTGTSATGDRAADIRRCENLTGSERETCLRDSPRAGASGTTGSATSGASTSPSGAAVTSGGSAPTGATAGPGAASPATAPGSATATKPDTSGHGKSQ